MSRSHPPTSTATYPHCWHTTLLLSFENAIVSCLQFIHAAVLVHTLHLPITAQYSLASWFYQPICLTRVTIHHQSGLPSRGFFLLLTLWSWHLHVESERQRLSDRTPSHLICCNKHFLHFIHLAELCLVEKIHITDMYCWSIATVAIQ